MLTAVLILCLVSVASLTLLVITYQNLKKNSKIIEHLMEENKVMRQEGVKMIIDAVEREKRDIGQDMHDELGSTLMTMKMNLGLIEKQGLFIFESNEALKELKYALDSSIDYVKGVSRITSPAFLENFGLSRAMVQMVKRINTSCTAKVEFEELGSYSTLEKDRQLHVFRIIQEVVNNSLRHASPWNITIRFSWSPTELLVEIIDDGYNYRLSDKYKAAGLGLNNIQYRANLIQANFTYDEGVQGNKAILRVPVMLPVDVSKQS